jgi:hypothetical protein
MTDFYLLLTPLFVIGVLGLIRFIGCDTVWGLTPVKLPVPTITDAIPGNQRVDLRWNYLSATAGSFTVMYGTVMGGPYPDEMLVPVTDDSITRFTAPVTGLANATTYYFVVNGVSKQGMDIGNSSEVSATPDPGFVLETPTLGPVQRNDIQGFVGMSITIGANDVVVTHLGRIHLPGNMQSHIVKIVDAATGMDVGLPVTIQMPSGPENDYAFEPMYQTATLMATRTYYVVSEERDGGDLWYDLPNRSTTTNVAQLNSGISKRFTEASYSAFGGANEMYGPVNFRY